MGYVRYSTANPLGRKPWNAVLQPGGLGAFFPNAEAIGSPSVMVDRDAANPGGWKHAPYAGAPVPRAYYAPDAYRQYTTPRAQGLGAVAPVVPHTNFVRAISRVLPPGYMAASTAPNDGVTTTEPTVSPIFSTPATLTPGTGGDPIGSWPIFQRASWPAVVPATTASGGSVMQSTGSSGASAAASTSTASTPVPSNFPTNQVYVDASGNVWAYNSTAGAWQIETAAAASSVVPAGYPTTQTYTDAAGNVWAYSDGAWGIIDAGSSSSASSITSWLSESTIWSAIPNWGVLVGGAGLLWFLTKKK
jgi:hypothetical protein